MLAGECLSERLHLLLAQREQPAISKCFDENVLRGRALAISARLLGVVAVGDEHAAAGSEETHHLPMDGLAVVHMHDAAAEEHRVERFRREVEVFDVLHVDPHPRRDAPLMCAGERNLTLLLAQRDAVNASFGVLSQVEQVRSPATSDVEHALSRSDRELLFDACELTLLRAFEILGGVLKDPGRVRETAVEHHGKDRRVVLVVRGNLHALVLDLLNGGAGERLALRAGPRGVHTGAPSFVLSAMRLAINSAMARTERTVRASSEMKSGSVMS